MRRTQEFPSSPHLTGKEALTIIGKWAVVGAVAMGAFTAVYAEPRSINSVVLGAIIGATVGAILGLLGGCPVADLAKQEAYADKKRQAGLARTALRPDLNQE